MTLIEFLLTRITEDEDRLPRHEGLDSLAQRRWRAECKAKRAIIDTAFDHAAVVDGEWGCAHNVDQIKAGTCPTSLSDAEDTVAPLAAVYADHPDYDEAWRA